MSKNVLILLLLHVGMKCVAAEVDVVDAQLVCPDFGNKSAINKNITCGVKLLFKGNAEVEVMLNYKLFSSIRPLG